MDKKIRLSFEIIYSELDFNSLDKLIKLSEFVSKCLLNLDSIFYKKLISKKNFLIYKKSYLLADEIISNRMKGLKC